MMIIKNNNITSNKKHQKDRNLRREAMAANKKIVAGAEENRDNCISALDELDQYKIEEKMKNEEILRLKEQINNASIAADAE